MTNQHSTVQTPEFLLQHASWAHSLARSLVGEGAADDLVQDAWMAALKTKPSSDRPLKPWLGTVLGNLARQRARGMFRRQTRETEAVQGGFEPSAAEWTERAESQKLLMEQLLKLDEGLREVLLLKYFEGLSAAEIGRRKGLPASTVKTRLQRGLDDMRASLEVHFGGDRNVWSLALLPLLHVRQAKSVGVVAASGGFGIKLAMQILVWVALGAVGSVVVVPLVANLPFFQEPVPIEEVTFEPLESIEPLEKPVALVPASEPLRESTASVAPGAVTPVVTPVRPEPTILQVRFLDPTGNPVSGVRLRSKWGRAASKEGSDLSGRLHFALASNGERQDAVVYFKPGLASDVLSFIHFPGGTVNLGDVEVVPGGALSGVVVDGLGNPLEGADVHVEGAEVVQSAGGGMTSRTLSSLGEAETKTNGRGEFRLSGLLDGQIRVKVSAKRGLHRAESGWVAIRAGQESRGLVIVAAEIPRGKRLEGFVLDPEGKPVAGANVSARFKTLFRSGSVGTNTDRTGFFRVFIETQASYELTFRCPTNHSWAPIILEDVEPGQTELRVQFDEPAFFTLRVVDEEGQPVPKSTCTVFDSFDERNLQRASQLPGSGGGLKLRVADEPVVLRVVAPGFAEKRVPVERAEVHADSVFTVTLRPLPGVAGRLVQDGEPVAGAYVYLQRKARGESKYNGFPVRFQGRSETSTISQFDGTFRLDVREGGQYVVRAVGRGVAPKETGWLELSPDTGLADLEMELSSGGSIEGAVVLEGDASPAGKFVAISRGDCWAETYRVGADGLFRFDHLTPGDWMVKLVDDGIDDWSTTSQTASTFTAPARIPSNCIVLEGQVTRHDLIPVPLSVCVLRGQLELTGTDLKAWSGSLVPESLEDGSGGGLRPGFLLDETGHFEIRVKGAGRWKLSFESPRAVGLNLWVSIPLEEGLNSWHAQIPTGGVRLHGAVHEPCIFYWEGPDGLSASSSVQPTVETSTELNPVPAGSARLMLLRDLRGLEPGSELPPAWVELNVPEANTLDVSLPR